MTIFYFYFNAKLFLRATVNAGNDFIFFKLVIAEIEDNMKTVSPYLYCILGTLKSWNFNQKLSNGTNKLKWCIWNAAVAIHKQNS